MPRKVKRLAQGHSVCGRLVNVFELRTQLSFTILSCLSSLSPYILTFMNRNY